jgi:hypothetical protein
MNDQVRLIQDAESNILDDALDRDRMLFASFGCAHLICCELGCHSIGLYGRDERIACVQSLHAYTGMVFRRQAGSPQVCQMGREHKSRNEAEGHQEQASVTSAWSSAFRAGWRTIGNLGAAV